jgi:hypothetical protein
MKFGLNITACNPITWLIFSAPAYHRLRVS